MLTVQSVVEVTSLWCQSAFKTFVSTTQPADILYTLPTASVVSVSWIVYDTIWRSSKMGKGQENGSASYSGLFEDSRGPEEGVELDNLKPPANSESGIFLDGVSITVFRFIRFLCVLAILSLQVRQVVFGGVTWIQVGLLDFYLYVAVLALGTLTLPVPHRDVASRHLMLSLVLALFIYIYLDAWPYATELPDPFDPADDPVTWVRLGLLGFAGGVIPLIMPRPFRPMNASATPIREDTVCLLSSVTYSYLDSIIYYAWRVPTIGIDDIPPFPEIFKASFMRKSSMKHLDPLLLKKYRYFAWSVLKVFGKDFSSMFFWLMLNAIFQFTAPFGIKNLLLYLETGESPYNMQPWFWILLLSVGPVFGACTYTQFLYKTSMYMMNAENVFTQVIFDHSMRIQLRGDALDEKKDKKDKEKTVNSPLTSESRPESETPTSGVQTPLPEASSSTAQSSSEVSVAGPVAEPEGGHAQQKTGHLIGKINNLITTDLDELATLFTLMFMPMALVQTAISIIFLYNLLGWSTYVGLALLIVLMPIPTLAGKFIIKMQAEKMEKTDARIQGVTEVLNVLRMVKLFAWEPRMLEKLKQKREDELNKMRFLRFLEIALFSMNDIIPITSSIGTLGVYTVVMKGDLRPSTIFSALMIFNILQDQLWSIIANVPDVLKAKVSLDRYNDFLNKMEYLPSIKRSLEESTHSFEPSVCANAEGRIGFRGVSFSWDPFDSEKKNGVTNTNLKKRKSFKLKFDEEVVFRTGQVNLILGPTASGKTSTLLALLGEMHHKLDSADSWFNLPRDGGIAYAAQESWVLNETIRDNILLGSPFDEVRYRKVLKQCALERDLDLWEAGDRTEVGEKGLTLSGGQKARVTLARALYSNASILLLDDVLAALDVHTAKFIAKEALSGDLVQGRTVLLVTHNIALTAGIADYVVMLGRNGKVVQQGTTQEVLKKEPTLRKQVEQERAGADIDGKEGLGLPKDDDIKGKLVVPEEKAIGRVEYAALGLYFGGAGGVLTWAALVGCFWLGIILDVSRTWYAGFWSSQYEGKDPSEVNSLKYLGYYALIAFTSLVIVKIGQLFWVILSLRAVRSVHNRLLESIFAAPLRWLDVVPVGRIITRCTRDISAIDGQFSWMFSFFLHMTLLLITYLVASVWTAGLPALLSGALVAGLGGFLGIVYLKAQLCIKREMSNAKAPVMSQVATVLGGLPSIRAYSAQSLFRKELMRRVDIYTRCANTYYNINRWISMRIDILGGIFSAVVTIYIVYLGNVSAGVVGFTLSLVLAFSREVLWWVRIYNLLEVQANSLERILEFLRIDHEPAPIPSGVPPAYWPASGSLRVEGLKARYSDESPYILQDVTFELKSGERVGVVGRTGAGKSSIALSLLRAIKVEGKVYYDDIATDTINLDALRRSITLIPQSPELVHGTLRENLDPFSAHDDAELNDALRSAGLFNVHAPNAPEHEGEDNTQHKIGLDTDVESGGSNFSLGQRQIIALARAIIRRSKLLILDEATAAIDYETDSAIQHFLRTELGRDTTVITIAHRLQTVMDSDKIMVLDAGRLVEFDTPKNLLENETGLLRALVNESDDKDALLKLAGLTLDK